MSWFSKKLKKITNVVDPVGKALRKSTGGSYGDPMNWYNSKPNTAPAYQPLKSQGLIAAPNGQQSLGTINIGGNSGGRTYVPNQFQNPMPQASTPGLTAPMGGKNAALPAGPVKGNMGFGGPTGSPLNGSSPFLNNFMQSYGQQQQQNPQLGAQMAQIQAMRGRMV